MKIGEVEKRIGIPKATIRYYEDKGLIHPARNNENNYRNYSEDDIMKLKHIKMFRALGVPIADIIKLEDEEIRLDEVINKRLEAIREEENSLKEARKIYNEIR